jgi:hypothetical protein
MEPSVIAIRHNAIDVCSLVFVIRLSQCAEHPSQRGYCASNWRPTPIRQWFNPPES